MENKNQNNVLVSDNEDKISLQFEKIKEIYDDVTNRILNINEELAIISQSFHQNNILLEEISRKAQEHQQEIANRKYQLQPLRYEISNISSQIEELNSYRGSTKGRDVDIDGDLQSLSYHLSELLHRSNLLEQEVREFSTKEEQAQAERSEALTRIHSLQQKQIHLMNLSSNLRQQQQALSENLANATKKQNEEVQKQLESIEKKRKDEQARFAEMYEQLSIRGKHLAEQESKLSQDSAQRLKEIQERESRLSDQEKTALTHLAKQRKDFEELREKELQDLRAAQSRVKEKEKELASARERQTKDYQEQLERSSAKYINDTLSTLNVNYKSTKSSASRWRGYGAISLVVAFGVLYYLSYSINPFDPAMGWKNISYLVLRGSAILALAGGVATYAVQASNRQSLEAAAIASKIHGIEYGAFFINTYGANARWAEIDNAFRHWHKHEENQDEGQ